MVNSSFKITESPNLAAWLQQQQLSLGFTTYQSNRLFIVGTTTKGQIVVHQELFDKPMGLYAGEGNLYMSTRYQIWRLDNRLATGETNTDKITNYCYLPSKSYTTGDLNVHDVVLDSNGKLLFVNTDFSCLATIKPGYSFEPLWKPPFISKLAAEDRCHLNGLAMVEGKPTYMTACSATDDGAGWRNCRQDGGVVMHIPSNEVIAIGLSMPHSPRWYKDKLWLLNSGTGELGYLDGEKFQPIAFCPGFVRGLAFWQDLAIVGLSKLRAASFSGLALENKLAELKLESQCGLMVIDLKTGGVSHWLHIEGMVEEMFDIVVLPGIREARIVALQGEDIERLINFPDLKSGGIVRQPSREETSIDYSEPLTPGFTYSRLAENETILTFPSPFEISNKMTPTVNDKQNLGREAYQRGKLERDRHNLEAARKSFEEAIRLQPDFVAAYNALGNVLQSQGQLEKAIATYQKALQLDPNYAILHCNLASVWHFQGKHNLAIAGYQRAIALKPDFFVAHHNLGKELASQKQLPAALDAYQKALSLKPEAGEVYLDLGNLYREGGQIEEAIASYKQAIRYQPKSAEAYNSLGALLYGKGELKISEHCYHRALALKPDFETVHYNLGLLWNKGEPEKAIVHFQRCVELQPEATPALLYLNNARSKLADWDNYRERVTELIASTREYLERKSALPLEPQLALTFPSNEFHLSLSLQAAVARKYARNFSQQAASMGSAIAMSEPLIPSARPLRVGYVSPDFANHAVGRLIADIFRYHQRPEFEIFAYSLVPHNDEITDRVRQGCDRFIDVSQESTPNIYQRIKADGIQILIDLAGYTAFSRTDLLALQPAPIQIHYLGFPGTSGADFIQYIIADSWLIPPELEDRYSETVIRLPHAWVASEMEIAPTPTRSQMGLPAEGTVFCCFNGIYKINPPVFEIWMRILDAVPQSVLWLSDGGNPVVAERLRERGTALGVDADRLIFAPNQPHPEYLARYRLADLFLDTFVYNAGATAVGALRAGLPVLTYPGETYASRMGASLCNAVGLPELVCDSAAAYERLAVELGNNPQRLQELKAKLSQSVSDSPLFQPEQFVRELERALRNVWQKYTVEYSVRNLCI